jgi:hypothetical protein
MKRIGKAVGIGACLLAFATGPAAAIRPVENFRLEDGRSDRNRISSPVWDTVNVAPVAIDKVTWKPGADYKLVRRLHRRHPQYTIAPSLDLGAQLAIALQNEGAALGLRMSAPGAAGWTIEGTVHDLYFEGVPIVYGPNLFYGFLDVALTVRQGEGEPRTVRYRSHNMYARFNGGFGLQDEVAEVTAHFLIDSAQEMLARLNRDFFQAPALPGIRLEAQALAVPLDDRETELRRIGLSGSPDAVPILLALLEKEKEEGNRVYVLDALANLGSADAVRPLAGRYDKEDEDCRYFILKAWDFIGGEEARAQIRQKGLKDKDRPAQSLASRVRE